MRNIGLKAGSRYKAKVKKTLLLFLLQRANDEMSGQAHLYSSNIIVITFVPSPAGEG